MKCQELKFKRYKQYLLEEGVTYRELSVKLGISRVLIEKTLNGKREPDYMLIALTRRIINNGKEGIYEKSFFS